jgi:IS30 family transposase
MTMASMRQQGSSMRAMARMLGRSASTISREFGRNTLAALPYASHSAQVSSQGRRQAARPMRKLDMQGVGWSVVLTLLDWKWSPQQIAGTLRRVFPNEPERHVSHETIYNAIYAQPRGELRRQLIACLRRGRSTRMPRTRGDDRRGQISEMAEHDRRRGAGFANSMPLQNHQRDRCTGDKRENMLQPPRPSLPRKRYSAPDIHEHRTLGSHARGRSGRA